MEWNQDSYVFWSKRIFRKTFFWFQNLIQQAYDNVILRLYTISGANLSQSSLKGPIQMISCFNSIVQNSGKIVLNYENQRQFKLFE